MNWDAVGAIGEMVGVAAVVVSLIYLAAQIRAQNRQARSVAIHEISAGFRESVTKFSDGEMAGIFVRGIADFDSLSDAETLQIIIGLAGVGAGIRLSHRADAAVSQILWPDYQGRHGSRADRTGSL